jgi:predicted transposase/invertase (TIGR01784 family)
MAKTTTPHDALFKACFGRIDIARSELELVLPPAVLAQLDLASLTVLPGSFIDDDLRQTHSDLLYGVRTVSGDPALVCVLAEAQSTFDPIIPLRLLEYAVRVWRRWLDDHRGSKIPLLVCVVLHHGDDRWSARPELSSMLDAGPDAIEAMRELTPHFRFILDDLTALSIDVLARRTLHVLGRLAQIALWTAPSAERFEQAAPLMQELARATTRHESTRSLLAQLYAYLLHVLKDVDQQVVYNKLLEIAGPEGREDVMTAAEQLINRGRNEARIETLRMTIGKLLAARNVALSEAGRARLDGCTDPNLLDRWYELALTVEKEADVFGA